MRLPGTALRRENEPVLARERRPGNQQRTADFVGVQRCDARLGDGRLRYAKTRLR